MTPIDTVDYYKEMGVRAIATLISLDCKKCNKCQKWMSKEYINKDNICDDCKEPEHKEVFQMGARDVWFALIIFIGFGLFGGYAYAGGVTDDNDGNKGYILVSTGENNGANSIGTWTDPSFLKGDKGDTGEQGIAGINGLDGKDGVNGINGIDGMNGLDGVKGDKGETGAQGIQGVAGEDGKDGINGVDGAQGDKGDTGNTGKDGLNGEKGDTGPQGNKGDLGNKGDTGEQGLQGLQGLIGLNGSDGKDVDPATVTRLDNKNNEQDRRISNVSSRVGKLERTQYVIHGELKFIREKHLEVGVYTEYNIGRSKVSEVGIAITVPIGESYLDRENKQIKSRLNRLEQAVGQTAVIEKTVDENGKTKSIHISRNGLQMNRSF